MTTPWRRGRSRRERFGASDWRMVEACLRQQWSPEQAAGWLRRRLGSRSATRPSTATSGATESAVGLYLHLFAQATPKTRILFPEVGWPGRYLSAQLAHRTSRVGRSRYRDRYQLRQALRPSSIVSLRDDRQARGCTVEATNRRAVRLIKTALAPLTPSRPTTELSSRLWGDRSRNRIEILLRRPLSFLGTRHQREHQRPDSSVPTEAYQHGSLTSMLATASLTNSTTDLVNDSASSPPRIVMNSTQQPSPCCTSKLIPRGATRIPHSRAKSPRFKLWLPRYRVPSESEIWPVWLWLYPWAGPELRYG